MAEIRSSLEIAMEKAASLGRASQEELQTDAWLEQGKKIGAQYLQEAEGSDLKKLLETVNPSGLSLVLRGVTEVLIRNVVLPRDKGQWEGIRRAMAGLQDVKGSSARQVVAQIEELLVTYERTRDHYREQLKAQFQGKLGGVQQAMARQYGTAAAKGLDVDMLPEFQQEWGRISGEIEDQVNRQLGQLKDYLRQI